MPSSNVFDRPFIIRGTLIAGIAARLWFYLLNDSFWRDETKLLLNVAQKSFLDLLNPLLYIQESPTGYVWLLKALWSMGLNSEMAVRSISLLASLLSLYLFYRLVSIALRDSKAGTFSLLLFALSPGLILYTGMAKQYTFDILAAVMLLYSSIRWFTGNDADTFKISKKQLLLAVLAPWFSLPSIFIIVALCAGLALRHGRRHRAAVLIFAAAACASFIVEWVVVIHRCSGLNAAIQQYGLHFSRIENWLYIFEQTLFAYTGPSLSLPLVLGLSAAAMLIPAGIITAHRRYGLSLPLLLLLPLLLALSASAAHMYPSYGRSLIFAAPAMYLCIGYGIERLAGFRGRSLVIGAVLAGMLVAPCAHETFRSYTKPTGGVREAMKFIADRQQKDDVVFCDDYAAPTILYYRLIGRPYAAALDFLIDPEKQIEGKIVSREIPGGLFDSAVADRRIWLVSETDYYAKGNRDAAYFHVRLAKFFKRFIGKNQIDYQFNGDDLSKYSRALVNHLSSKRKIVHKYITDRVQVYGFEKQ